MNLDIVIPSRSRHQLRHFVVGAHDTAPMRFRQILLEAQDLAYNIKLAELDIAKKRIQIERLRSTGDDIDELTAQECETHIELQERTLLGAKMELNYLSQLAEENGSFSLEEIEADQPNYWTMRLSRQAGLDQAAIADGVGKDTLQSMLSMGLLQKEIEA